MTLGEYLYFYFMIVILLVDSILSACARDKLSRRIRTLEKRLGIKTKD